MNQNGRKHIISLLWFVNYIFIKGGQESSQLSKKMSCNRIKYFYTKRMIDEVKALF